MKSFVATTSESVEGYQITEYVGIVSSASVIVFPGGNKMVQNAWKIGVQSAVDNMRQQALGMDADAIIAMRFELYNGNLCATGTAVKLK